MATLNENPATGQDTNSPLDTEQWTAMADEYRQTAEHAIRENPLAVTLAAFGVGLGIGAIVGGALGHSSHRRHAHFTQNLGRRVLDSLSDVMPDSVQQHLRG